jgi:CelD/BcsL family acetyltransferase involved in cellulose biosynthesis
LSGDLNARSVSATTGIGVDALAPAWEELADQVGAAPFLRPGWVAAWWRAFGRGTLQPLTVHHSGRLVAVLPIARRRGALSSPSNDHTPLFGAVLDSPETAAALADAVLASRPSRVRLGYVRAGGAEAEALLTAAGAAGYRTFTRTIWHSPYLEIAGDFAAYEAARRRSALSDLRRRRRRMADHGTVSVDVCEGSARLEVSLREAFDIEVKGWKGTRGTAITSRAETRRFYAEVAEWAAHRGWLRLFFLRLDGLPLAFYLSLEHEGVQYLLKGGFDPAFARFAPGQQLLHELIRRAFVIGVRRIEFGGAAEAYKLLWTDTTRGRDEIRAFSPSPLGRFAWVAEGRLMPLARRTHLTRAIGTARAQLRARLPGTGGR